MILPLAIPYWGTGLLVGAFLIVCVMMILIVLIQRPQGGGLSGAFGAGGGGGAGQTAFGTKTGDALTYATIGMFLLYLAFAVGLNFATRPENITAGTLPIVQSDDLGETTDSGPLDPAELGDPSTPAEGDGATETDAASAEGEDTETADPAGEGDAALDAIGAIEQAAEEIIDDATSAPTEPPADAPVSPTEDSSADTDPSADPATPPTL